MSPLPQTENNKSNSFTSWQFKTEWWLLEMKTNLPLLHYMALANAIILFLSRIMDISPGVPEFTKASHGC